MYPTSACTEAILSGHASGGSEKPGKLKKASRQPQDSSPINAGTLSYCYSPGNLGLHQGAEHADPEQG